MLEDPLQSYRAQGEDWKNLCICLMRIVRLFDVYQFYRAKKFGIIKFCMIYMLYIIIYMLFIIIYMLHIIIYVLNIFYFFKTSLIFTLLSSHKLISKLEPSHPLSVLTGTGLLHSLRLPWNPLEFSMQPELQVPSIHGPHPPGITVIGFGGSFETQSPP